MKSTILMLMLCTNDYGSSEFGKEANTQQIMQSLPDVAKANEMEALRQKENDLKSMQDELQRKADEYVSN